MSWGSTPPNAKSYIWLRRDSGEDPNTASTSLVTTWRLFLKSRTFGWVWVVSCLRSLTLRNCTLRATEFSVSSSAYAVKMYPKFQLGNYCICPTSPGLLGLGIVSLILCMLLVLNSSKVFYMLTIRPGKVPIGRHSCTCSTLFLRTPFLPSYTSFSSDCTIVAL